MKAVVNAPPLIALARVDQLALLNQLFDEVLVPPAVYQEVTVQGVNLPGAALVMQSDWIRVQAPVTPPTIEPLLLGLDAGEMEVLLLAQDVQPAQVVIDERIGRRVAQALRIPLTGTLGVLLAAFRAELLTKQQASDAAHEMVAKGIRIGTPLLAWFEREINQ
jgi:predicted nucleic acid-binding protein